MDRGTTIFWSIVALLFAASAFFAVQGGRLKRSIQRAGVTVSTGDLVTLASVTDGDSVIVRTAAGDDVVVRIIGIKSLEAGAGKESLGVYGVEAKHALDRACANKAIRVLLGNPPKDKHGRSLATLYVEDEDVALRLVKDGSVLVYTAFPFPDMQRYLDEQAGAKAQRKGLWADPAAVARADLLLGMWRREAP